MKEVPREAETVVGSRFGNAPRTLTALCQLMRTELGADVERCLRSGQPVRERE